MSVKSVFEKKGESGKGYLGSRLKGRKCQIG